MSLLGPVSTSEIPRASYNYACRRSHGQPSARTTLCSILQDYEGLGHRLTAAEPSLAAQDIDRRQQLAWLVIAALDAVQYDRVDPHPGAQVVRVKPGHDVSSRTGRNAWPAEPPAVH